MRIALILNLNAGKSLPARPKVPTEDLEKRLLEIMRDRGIEPEVYYTTPDDSGREIAHRLADEGADYIVAAGGDGTIHAVAQGLINSQSVLGIIPVGTMNNLARSLGIPEELEDACVILSEGETRSIDIGRLNEHTFLEVAGIGLEAALFPAASKITSRGLFSNLRGAVSGLYTLLRFRAPHIRISFDNARPHTYRAIQVTICNSPYYGPRLRLSTDILMNDGWLDVVLYTNFSKREYIRHAISISQGRRPFAPKVLHLRVQSLHIVTDEPIEIQADGIVRGHTPAQVTIIPDALKVRVPSKPGPGLCPTKSQKDRSHRLERKQTYA